MTVDELLAREEIRQAVLRHFRAADRVDAALERAAFWPDGHFVGGPMDGRIADIVPTLYGDLLGRFFETTCHYIMNLMTTVTGERARVEAYGIGYHLIANDAEALVGVLGEATFAEFGRDSGRRYELLVGVRYAIVLERRAGEWRILTMQPIVDWTRAQPYAGIAAGGLPAAIAARGRRDRDDASYFGQDWTP